jgi:hypothetical protein
MKHITDSQTPLFSDHFTYRFYYPHTILDFLRIKILSALRSYTFSSDTFVTFHNFVTQTFLMNLPYRRIYVKNSGV